MLFRSRLEMSSSDFINWNSIRQERGLSYPKSWKVDFSANAVARIDKDGKIQRIAQSPDCDGSDGGLDQPGEPIVWNGQVIVSCFDLVTGPDKVNTKHDKPFTLAKLSLE